MADTRFLFAATVLLAAFGAIRIASASPVAWLSEPTKGLMWLETFLLFIGAFAFVRGWLGGWKLALIFAGLAVIGFFYATTGALF